MLKNYKSPQISIFEIHIEDSISNASQRQISGGDTSDYTPSEEDWITIDSETKGFEF